MSRALLPLLPLVLLAGCGADYGGPRPGDAPPPPKIEVPVACLDARDIPPLPSPLPPRPSSLSAAADLLKAKVDDWEVYGRAADPLLKGCAR